MIRPEDVVRAASNAAHIARDSEAGVGTVIERDQAGRWTSVPVGRGDADRCEQRAPSAPEGRSHVG